MGTKAIPPTPPLLYHYTDHDGLVGVIESKALWATEVSYLNDLTEGVYGRGLLAEVADRMDPGQDADWGMHVACAIASGIGRNEDHLSTFVTCLCAEGDTLSLWRGYVGRGGGYSIGIHRETLDALGLAQSFSLVPLIYDRYEQVGHIETLIRDARHRVVEKSSGSLSEQEGTNLLLEVGTAFIFAMLSVKHPDFRDEREWRLAHVAIKALWPSREKTRTLRGVDAP